ncbi:MAG: hypothetical protein GX270_03920 [Clostridiaceae bacterium]|jgi:hypothetical protein|nr:hypothetical protein [Clostridiaceae bacterium]
MMYAKIRLLSESVKFIELCQGNVLNGKINICTYSLLSDIKIDFLKNFLNTEMSDLYIDRDFLNRIRKLFTINYLIKSRGFSDVKMNLN